MLYSLYDRKHESIFYVFIFHTPYRENESRSEATSMITPGNHKIPQDTSKTAQHSFNKIITKILSENKFELFLVYAVCNSGRISNYHIPGYRRLPQDTSRISQVTRPYLDLIYYEKLRWKQIHWFSLSYRQYVINMLSNYKNFNIMEQYKFHVELWLLYLNL